DVEDVSFGYENLVAERFVWLEHETEHVDGREEHLVPYPTERFDLLARAAGFATMVVDVPDSPRRSSERPVRVLRLTAGAELSGRLAGIDHPELSQLVLFGDRTSGNAWHRIDVQE